MINIADIEFAVEVPEIIWCTKSFSLQTQLRLCKVVLRLSWGFDNKNKQINNFFPRGPFLPPRPLGIGLIIPGQM